AEAEAGLEGLPESVRLDELVEIFAFGELHRGSADAVRQLEGGPHFGHADHGHGFVSRWSAAPPAGHIAENRKMRSRNSEVSRLPPRKSHITASATRMRIGAEERLSAPKTRAPKASAPSRPYSNTALA